MPFWLLGVTIHTVYPEFSIFWQSHPYPVIVLRPPVPKYRKGPNCCLLVAKFFSMISAEELVTMRLLGPPASQVACHICYVFRQAANDNLPSYRGFYSVKRNCFYDAIVQCFIDGLNVPISITRYKNPTTKICSLLIKIGQGYYPSKPLDQVKDQQQPPNHQLEKEERQLVATSLLKLCNCQEPDTTSTTDTSPPSIDATIALPPVVDVWLFRCWRVGFHLG
jgi:hypothetical protein